MFAERDDAFLFLRRQQDAPAIVRHFHIVELGPAARIDRIGGAQIDQRLLEAVGPHVVRPPDVTGMPAFQRLEPLPILAEIHVVGNLGAVIDVHDVHGVLLGGIFRHARACPAHPRLPFITEKEKPWMAGTSSAKTRFALLPGHDATKFTRPASYRTAPSGRCRSAAARRSRRPRWGAEKSSSATPSAARRFSIPWSRARRSAGWLPCR